MFSKLKASIRIYATEHGLRTLINAEIYESIAGSLRGY
jgi:hypothetical protein